MKKIIACLFILFTVFSYSQEQLFTTQDIEVNSLINGTLYTPIKESKKTKLVILIAGSGPTNRSGNSLIAGSNNSLKYLAEGLAKNGIAVFSYDKRIFALMKSKKLDEKSLRFEDMIADADSVFDYFKAQKKYKKIIFAGHSEGSLIGMIASKDKADGFVSLSGIGRPIEEVLSEQISENSPNLKEDADKGFALFKEGKTFENKNPLLNSLFRESIQPYMISWFKYNAQEEIKKLTIPVLLVNGTKDLQVQPIDAQLLKKAYPKAKLVIIKNMNHVLKEISNDDDNIKSYSDSKLPVMKELIDNMTAFVKKI